MHTLACQGHHARSLCKKQCSVDLSLVISSQQLYLPNNSWYPWIDTIAKLSLAISWKLFAYLWNKARFGDVMRLGSAVNTTGTYLRSAATSYRLNVPRASNIRQTCLTPYKPFYLYVVVQVWCSAKLIQWDEYTIPYYTLKLANLLLKIRCTYKPGTDATQLLQHVPWQLNYSLTEKPYTGT